MNVYLARVISRDLMLQFFETQEQCRSLKQEITQSLIIDDPIVQNG